MHYTYNFSKSEPQAESFENLSLDFLISALLKKAKLTKLAAMAFLLSCVSYQILARFVNSTWYAQAWFQG